MRLHSKAPSVLDAGQGTDAAGDAPEAKPDLSEQNPNSAAAIAAEPAPLSSIADHALDEGSERLVWPSTFPHVEIDELMTRVPQAASLSASDAMTLLAGIVDEARRLRATVVRLTSEKLSSAEQEAEQILQAAREEAAQLRRSANEAMVQRLDDAESASAAVLYAAQVDAHRRSRQGQQLLATTRAEVEDLRARVSAIFDSTNGILPLLGETASSLRRMEQTMSEKAPDATAPPTIMPAECAAGGLQEQSDPAPEAAIAAPESQDEQA